MSDSKYKLGKKLGSGSFANVFIAEDIVKKEFVAMKKYNLDPRSSEEGSVLFTAESSAKIEIDILSRTVHPYIIKMEDVEIKSVGNGKDQKYFVSIPLELGMTNLEDILTKSSHFPRFELRKIWCEQFLLGVKFLLQNGIYHCDMKLDNIILIKDGSLRIADFGLTYEKYNLPQKIPITRCGAKVVRAPEYYRIQDVPYFPERGISFQNYTQKNFGKYNDYRDLISGELFSVGLIILYIYSWVNVITNPPLLMRYVFRDSIDTFENRAEKVRNISRDEIDARNKKLNNLEPLYEYIDDPLWVNLITTLTNGDPIERYNSVDLEKGLTVFAIDPENPDDIQDPIFQQKIDLLFGNHFDFKYQDLTYSDMLLKMKKLTEISYLSLADPILDYTISGSTLTFYIKILKTLCKFGLDSDYNVWQLANLFSLYRYTLHLFLSSKLDISLSSIACAHLSIGRNSPYKKLPLSKVVTDLKGIKYYLNIRDIYIKIFKYMNGTLRVKSICDTSFDIKTILHSFDYYCLPQQTKMDEYMSQVSSRYDFDDIMVENITSNSKLSEKINYKNKELTIASFIDNFIIKL